MGKPNNEKQSSEIWVNRFTEDSAQDFREELLAKSEEDPSGVIQINIDSYGGSVDALAKMIETMDELPNQFLTRISGKAMSCGAILASHGDIRFVGELSSVMVHNISWGVGGDVTNMVSVTDEAQRINKRMMGLLAKNCGKSYTALQKEIKASTNSKEIWMDAEEAFEFGICDFVGTPQLLEHRQTQLLHAPAKTRAEGIDLEMFAPEQPKKKTKKKARKK
jgi:ATP-dependent Clp protease protease subunit